jgi:hypothetical protein
LRRLGGPIAQTIEGVSDLFAETRMSLPAFTRILMAVAGRVGACHFADADIPRSSAAGNQPFAPEFDSFRVPWSYFVTE